MWDFWVRERNFDIDERLENASMAYALRQAGLDINPVAKEDFGKTGRKIDETLHPEDVKGINRYWEIPDIDIFFRRKYQLASMDELQDLTKEWNTDLFVKHVVPKKGRWAYIYGSKPFDVFQESVYSFCDAGKCFLAQEFCNIRDEYRFFVVNGKISTYARYVATDTPLVESPKHISLYDFAEMIIPYVPYKYYTLDLGYINGFRGLVEMNPLTPGRIGLFGCDVMKLARDLVDGGYFDE